MTVVAKAADAAQFLSLIPRMLGYTPTRSLVVVPMSMQRSLGVIRFDLPPDEATDEVTDAVAAAVIGMLCRIDGADAALLAAYAPEPAAGGLPHRALLHAVHRRLHAAGLGTVEALVVAQDGWGSAFDGAVRPLAAIASTPLAGDIAGDQHAGTQLPGSASRRRATHTAMRSLRTALETAAGVGCGDARTDGVARAALRVAAELDDLPALVERMLSADPATLPPMRLALLAWLLSRPALRDIALVQWTAGRAVGEEAVRAQDAWEQGAEYPAELAGVLCGEGTRPDPERLERALQLCRHVAGAAPSRERPGALAAAAWLSWALGRSTHAGVYADRARELDPAHGLAQIVGTMVDAAHLPDWAFHRP